VALLYSYILPSFSNFKKKTIFEGGGRRGGFEVVLVFLGYRVI
jgi:hypothetical protein